MGVTKKASFTDLILIANVAIAILALIAAYRIPKSSTFNSNVAILVAVTILSLMACYFLWRGIATNRPGAVHGTDCVSRDQFFYASPIPMWIYDVETLQILDVNDAACTHYGYPKDEFLQLTILDIRSEQQHHALLDYLENKEEPLTGDHLWKHKAKSGAVLDVKLNAHNIAYGNTKARLVAVFDYTDVLKSRNVFKEQREFLAQILEAIDDAIWIVSKDLTLLEFNKSFQDELMKKFGIPVKRGDHVIFDDLSSTLIRCMNNAYARAFHGESLSFDYAIPLSGDELIARITIVPVRNNTGAITYLVCTGADVTQYYNLSQSRTEALKQYELITQLTNDAVWELDLADDSLKWGPGLTDRFGYSIKRTDLQWWLQRIHPDDVERVNRSLQEVIDGSASHWRDTYRFKTAADTYKHVIDQGYIMRDSEGQAYKMIGAIQDINELVKSRQEIEKLSIVASKSSNAVIISNGQEEIEWVNEGFVRLCGYTLNEVMGKKPKDLLQGPGTDADTTRYIRHKLDNKEPVTAELINYRKDGSKYWVEMTITPVVVDGNVHKFIAIETDITERKRQQELLKKKNKQLRQIAFVTAHELRRPVANILGLGEFLEENQDKINEVAEISSKLVASCRQLDHTINKIVQSSYEAETDD